MDLEYGNVWISIRGRQLLTEAFWEDSMDLVTSGTLSRGPEGLVVTYAENAASGMGDTQTTLMLNTERLTMMRSGDVTTQMVFEPGRKHVTYYETEFGVLTIGVNTSRLLCDISDKGDPIDIEMEYTLEVDNEMTGANIISIRVSGSADCGDGHTLPPIEAKPPRNWNLGQGSHILH